ncbi:MULTISPECIES: BREX-2 system phosphatase PglZ [unclassified Kitasatospora]|uniref:BREX-2 system phosphatase PglZ n=1 Tax=unclassified Kitasatospora TaxID=2633591 RepID=UPI0033FB17DA
MSMLPPLVNRRVLEALLRLELPAEPERRLVLVHGRYEPGGATGFTAALGEEKRRVEVVEDHSVLGISDAWHRHREAAPGDSSVLVVATGVADGQLGWDLLGHALRRQVLNVDRAEIVRLRFGATDLDPRIRAESWLVNALLDAEPHSGWPRAGSVLTLDAAMRALVEARLSIGDWAQEATGGRRDPVRRDTPLDADTLLSWSRSPAGPAGYAALAEEERQGISAWLTKVVGEAAPLLLNLCAAGRGHEAMALGLVGSVLTGPSLPAEAGLALGSLFGSVRPKPSELQAFTAAVEGTLTRWLLQAEQAGAHQYAARDRALQVLRQADLLAEEAGLSAELAQNGYLPSGFQARLSVLAELLDPATPGANRDPNRAADALERLRHHHLASFLRGRVRTAEAAVRLVRWLAEPQPALVSVADAVERHLADWGWVDAALTILWAGDAEASPAIGAAYRSVYLAARERRAAIDETFAGHLREWTRNAGSPTPAGALLVEDVLAKIAAKIAGREKRAPLVLLLDGMSSEVAVGFGAELSRRGWLEAGPTAGTRSAAVAAIPSLTRISRASLLTGSLTSGGQSVEKPGFAAFWSRQRRSGVLFHKADIGGAAGQRLAEELQRELAGDAAVGVVLNTVDDSLDHAAQGDRTRWRLADVTYLEELLSAARLYGRPVVLVADHGHVLERGEGLGAPAAGGGVGAARWRTGEPEDGEVLLAGPRVLEGGGRIVAPWREDIRYTPRKAGYHGGASLAEMTVPVLVLLPSEAQLPKGWSLIAPEQVTPRWWNAHEPAVGQAAGSAVPAVFPSQEPRTKAAKAQAPVEAAQPEAERSTPTFGQRLAGSDVFASQRQYVRAAPDAAVVAAALDALVAADGLLSLVAVAKAAGKPGRSVDGFAAQLQRLLNVESYPVLEFTDNGTRLRLNVQLAVEQFQLEDQ